jgi:hypothetical protein
LYEIAHESKGNIAKKVVTIQPKPSLHHHLCDIARRAKLADLSPAHDAVLQLTAVPSPPWTQSNAATPFTSPPTPSVSNAAWKKAFALWAMARAGETILPSVMSFGGWASGH